MLYATASLKLTTNVLTSIISLPYTFPNPDHPPLSEAPVHLHESTRKAVAEILPGSLLVHGLVSIQRLTRCSSVQNGREVS